MEKVEIVFNVALLLLFLASSCPVVRAKVVGAVVMPHGK